jgi:hypothetical protein
MRISGPRFSVTPCMQQDNLPDKAFRLLFFLFSVSDISGRASPGYAAMKIGADITSRSTISDALKLLKRHGWFHFVKKGNGRNTVFFLRIPPRFSKTDKKELPAKITAFPKDW